MRLFRWTAVLALAWSCSGCVAYQIRDELRTTNKQLDKITADLDRVDSSLDQTNQKLNQSNQSLASVESSMEPIRISLRRIDDELAAFRQMVDKIDKYIPLNIKAETPPPARQSPTTQTTPQR